MNLSQPNSDFTLSPAPSDDYFLKDSVQTADGRSSVGDWLPKVVADLADLEDEEVLGRERVVELVRVDLEQDRGHSRGDPIAAMVLPE